MVQSTAWSSEHPASSVLILGQRENWDKGAYNYWLAEREKTEGQGFTLKLDNCTRMITGCRIMNKGVGNNGGYATRGFKILGSKNENGPWEILLEHELPYTEYLQTLYFEEPVELQFLKFELVSYWKSWGGIRYFAPILAPSKAPLTIFTSLTILNSLT